MITLRKNISQIISITKREIGFIFKNRSVLLLLFAGPIIYSFLYTCIFTSKSERDVPVAIIDNDHSETSRMLIRYLDSHESIKTENVLPGNNDIKDIIYTMKYMAVVIIPDNFESMLKKGRQAKLSVTVNTTRFMITNDVLRGISDVLSEMSRSSICQFYKTKGNISTKAKAFSNPLRLEIRSVFNTTEAYGDFIIVGLLALIFQQTLLIGAAVSMANEKENNSINDLLHKTSGSVFRVLSGKAIVYFVVFGIFTFFFFNFHYYLYKIPFNGSLLLLGCVTVLQIFTVMLMGFIIGTFFKSKLMALIFLAFMSYPVFLLSGYSWPIQAIPDVLQVIAYILPQTWYFDAYVIIAQKGGKLGDVLQQIIHISILAVIFYIFLEFRLRHLSCRH